MTNTISFEDIEYSPEQCLELCEHMNSSKFGDEYVASIRKMFAAGSEQGIIDLSPEADIEVLASRGLQAIRDRIKLHVDIDND